MRIYLHRQLKLSYNAEMKLFKYSKLNNMLRHWYIKTSILLIHFGIGYKITFPQMER